MKTKSLFLLLICVVFISCNHKNEVGKEEMYRIQVNGLYGFIDEEGNEVIKPQYKYVSSFSRDGYACVISDIKMDTAQYYSYLQDSILTVTYGYINQNNDLVVDTVNTIQLSFGDLNSVLMMNSTITTSYKYINGCLEFRDRLLRELDFNDGLFVYQDETTQKFGYKDINGNVAIEAAYSWCRAFTQGVAVVVSPLELDFNQDIDVNAFLKRFGVIDKSGTVMYSGYYTINDYNKEGYTWAMVANLSETYEHNRDWVKLDKKGNIVLGPVPNAAWVYNNEPYPICCINLNFLGFYYTFLDENGLFMTDFNKNSSLELDLMGDKRGELYADVTPFSNGVAGVKGYTQQDQPVWYFVDKDFNPISHVLYDSVLCFDNCYAAVEKRGIEDLPHSGMWGYVKLDTLTNEISEAIPCLYSECGRFVRELAYFKKAGSTFDIEGYLNKQGEIVWQTRR